MQLEFQFVKEFRSMELMQEQVRNQVRAFFETLQWPAVVGDFAREQHRSGGLFIYRQEPQLTFPHSDYWDCPECEP